MEQPSTVLRWSLLALDADTGEVLASRHPDRVLRTASVAKLLLLTEVAARVTSGTADPAAPLARDSGPAVQDSGLWQALTASTLSRADCAALVAAVSDNQATNVLLADVGLDAVRSRTRSLGLSTLDLLDFVRPRRTPDLPETLSTGSAQEWARFLLAAHRGDLVSAEVSDTVLGWMALSADHGLVAAPWHLDPLAGADQPSGVTFRGKTGSDDGIRADVGLLTRDHRTVAWAAVVNWPPSAPPPPEVYDEMAALGRLLAAHLDG